MRAFPANKSANKSFATRASELLTSNSRDMHELLTELFTAAQRAAEELKTETGKAGIVAECGLLQRSLHSGWLAALRLEPCPAEQPWCSTNPLINVILPAICTQGYQFGQRQVAEILRRGQHISQPTRAELQKMERKGL